jgi:hypothetical protein
MSEPNVITVQGDWWWIAAIIQRAIDRTPDPEGITGWGRATTRAGTIIEGHYDSEPMVWDIRLECRITGQQGKTRIEVIEWPQFQGYWQPILDEVRTLEISARETRRAAVGVTADAIAEEYERAKAAGENVTLKQLAEEVGLSYNYVRKRKSKKTTAKQAGNKQGNRGG